MTSPILLFATRNQGKVAELLELTSGLGIEVKGLEGWDLPEVKEDGETFAENAAKKALDVSRRTGLPALADDSGLIVDFLGGAPGVHSARYAGLPSDDEANNQKLLSEMASASERSARFHSSLALADCQGALGEELIYSEGQCEGEILREPRGEGGFGYDPLFYSPELGSTFAEAGTGSKNQLSHRARAMAALVPKLCAYFRLKNEAGPDRVAAESDDSFGV